LVLEVLFLPLIKTLG